MVDDQDERKRERELNSPSQTPSGNSVVRSHRVAQNATELDPETVGAVNAIHFHGMARSCYIVMRRRAEMRIAASVL